MESKDQKYLHYATLITAAIGSMFDGEGDFQINQEELFESDNLKSFLHALSNVVPTHFFNELTDNNKNHLEFNHIANLLCFEFMTNK